MTRKLPFSHNNKRVPNSLIRIEDQSIHPSILSTNMCWIPTCAVSIRFESLIGWWQSSSFQALTFNIWSKFWPLLLSHPVHLQPVPNVCSFSVSISSPCYPFPLCFTLLSASPALTWIVAETKQSPSLNTLPSQFTSMLCPELSPIFDFNKYFMKIYCV